MSKNGPCFEQVYSFKALWRAFKRARRAKPWTDPEFFLNCDERLLELSQALQERRWNPDPYRYFIIRNTKSRVVSEASFRNRVVHHALIAALDPLFESKFIPHSYACRAHKGTHAAVAAVQRMSRRWPYALRLDIARYFDHIRHDTLMALLQQEIQDEGLLWLCQRLLSGASLPTVPPSEQRGLPIGNLTSQFWANVYLHPIDLRASSTASAYARYMDDLVLFGPSKAALWACLEDLQEQLLPLGLRLKSSVTRLQPVTEGFPWLGFQIYPNTLRLLPSTRRRFHRKLTRSLALLHASPSLSPHESLRQQSLCAHIQHANTLALRRQILSTLPHPLPLPSTPC